MSLHAYLVQVSRAAPALFTHCHDRHGRPVDPMHYILHYLPLVHARGILHTAAILDGQAMTWTDPRLTQRGRWWLKVRQLWKRGTDPAARGTPTTFRKMMRKWDEEAMTNDQRQATASK